MIGRMEKMVRETQAKVVAAIEEVDGCQFRTDAFTRAGGGGGITRVLQVRRPGAAAGRAGAGCRGLRAVPCIWVIAGARPEPPGHQLTALRPSPPSPTQGGRVWEKAGVAVSAVYGTMPAESYRAVLGKDVKLEKGDRVPFKTVGVSSVMHPLNPHCPTMHFNYR